MWFAKGSAIPEESIGTPKLNEELGNPPIIRNRKIPTRTQLPN
jgi:hypothetical protein